MSLSLSDRYRIFYTTLKYYQVHLRVRARALSLPARAFPYLTLFLVILFSRFLISLKVTTKIIAAKVTILAILILKETLVIRRS